MNEIKNKQFKILAEKHVNKALESIESLRKLAYKDNCTYSKTDVQKIEEVLKAKVLSVVRAFKAERSAEKPFRLDEDNINTSIPTPYQKTRCDMEKLGLLGEKLMLKKDPGVTCVVLSARQVKYDEKPMSPSDAATSAYRGKGAKGHRSGPEHWLYKGKTLSELWRRYLDNEEF